MSARRDALQEDVRFRVLRCLRENPEISQRQLAEALGVSLGATNYCLSALVEKGFVKLGNFSAADDKREKGPSASGHDNGVEQERNRRRGCPSAPTRSNQEQHAGGNNAGAHLHSQGIRVIDAWPADAIDSILTLSFWPQGDGARVELAHINVADEDFAGVSQGWEKYYWTPWRAYLEARG